MNININDEQAQIYSLAKIVSEPQACPYCNEMMRGPYNQYKMRETELYFDLEKKYFHCDFCEKDVEIVDFKVIVDRLCEKLPPNHARTFSMKNHMLFETMPEMVRTLFSIIQDEYNDKVTLPVDNLACMETNLCEHDGKNHECIHCIKCIEENSR